MMKSDNLPVTSAGANTLLLALRCLQQRTPQERQALAEEILNQPDEILSDEEIDDLCEEINYLEV